MNINGDHSVPSSNNPTNIESTTTNIEPTSIEPTSATSRTNGVTQEIFSQTSTSSEVKMGERDVDLQDDSINATKIFNDRLSQHTEDEIESIDENVLEENSDYQSEVQSEYDSDRVLQENQNYEIDFSDIDESTPTSPHNELEDIESQDDSQSETLEDDLVQVSNRLSETHSSDDQAEIQESDNEDPQFMVEEEDVTAQQVFLTLAQIQALAAANDPTKSTQSILAEIAKNLSVLYPGSKIVISKTIGDNGRYQPQRFTHPKSADMICFKATAHYKVEVEGVQVSIPTITRDIYTTSSNEDDAISAAAMLARILIGLAKKDANLADDIQGLPTDQNQYNSIMNMRAFSFKVSPDWEQGSLTFFAGKTELKFKKNEDESLLKEYVYDKDTDTLEVIEGERPDSQGRNLVYYSSEEEAILNINHQIKNDDLYQKLEKDPSKSIQNLVEDLKEEIKQKEIEIAELKTVFESKPRFKYFGGKKEITKQFQQFVAGLAPKKAKPEDLSPAMQAYLNKENELKVLVTKYGSDQANELDTLKKLQNIPSEASHPIDEETTLMQKIAQDHALTGNPPEISDLIAAKEQEQKDIQDARQEIDSLKKEVIKEQAYFMKALNQMENLNRELNRINNTISQTISKANDELNDPSGDHKKAKVFLKALAASDLKALNTRIDDNRAFITKIQDLLPSHLNKKLDVSVIGISDTISDLDSQGEILLKQGKIDEALTEFKKALKLNRRDPVALAGYAEVLRQKGKLQEAMTLFTRSLKIGPRSALALEGYGEICVSQNDLLKAEKLFEEAVKLEPASVLTLNRYAEILFLNKKSTQAETIFNEVLTLEPNNKQAEDGLRKIGAGQSNPPAP